jgi:methionine-rich copper-binding protein CopC
MTSRFTRRALAIAAASVALWAAGTSAALAHSGLESSNPADGSVISEAPASISLTFNEELLPDADSISLNAADGTNIVSAKVQPTGSTVEIPWPVDLAPGAYQVAFRVVSADGHPVTGAIGFTFAPADVPAEASSSTPAPGSSEASEASPTAMPISDNAEPEPTGGNPWLGLGIGVVIGLVLVVLFAAMRRRRA